MAILFKKWSASKLMLFEACPFAFYCQEILKLAQLASATAEVGSAVHAALESIFRSVVENNMKPPAKKDISKFITKACGDKLTKGIHPKKDATEISSMVNNGLAQIDLRNFEGVGIEKWFEIVIDKEGHVVRGKIDLELIMSGGLPYVIDYKTGSEFDPMGDIQLQTYALAQWARGYLGDVLGGLFFLRKKELKPTLISPKQIQEVLALYRETAQDVEKRLKVGESAFDARPCYKCEYCSYSGLCPIVKKIGEFPPTVDDVTPERAKVLAEFLLVAERNVAVIKEIIKEYASRQVGGFYEVNGGHFGKKTKSSLEFKLGDVMDTLKKLGIDDAVFRNISLGGSDVKSYVTAKKYSETTLRAELENKASLVTRNYFDYYKGIPLKEEEVDEVAETDVADVA